MSLQDFANIAPERDKQSLSTSIGGLLVFDVVVKGYTRAFRVLIDSGASCNYARRDSVRENAALYARACSSSARNDKVAIRLATGSIVTQPKVTIDLRISFEGFDSVESFVMLDMDEKYDLILGMPWLQRHEPWIDWRSKAIGPSASYDSMKQRFIGECSTSEHIDVGVSEVVSTTSGNDAASAQVALEACEPHVAKSQMIKDRNRRRNFRTPVTQTDEWPSLAVSYRSI